MFVRVVKGSSKQYVLIVRSFRDKEGKPRQETVFNLGPVNDKTRNATVNLAKRMISNLESNHFITGGEDIKEVIRYNWGAPAIIESLWVRFSMEQVIKSPKAKAIKLMLINRLLSPNSKLATYNTRHRYQGFEQLDLNQMYRSLDYLADNADNIKSHIYGKQKLQGISEVVFFDVTTLYFESQKADLLRDFGYSKDFKVNEVQIVLCLVIDASGKPLSYEVFAGNTFEGATLLPMLSRLKEQFGINRIIIVADRGIGSKANLQAIKNAGYEYIVGAKLRAASQELQQQAIEAEEFIPLYQDSESGEIRKYKFIQNGQQDWVILHSTKRARKDMNDRQKLVQRAQDMLESGNLKQTRGARKFIASAKKESQSYTLDLDKIAHEAKFDGYYALSFSDRTLSAETIAKAYHGLWMVEESFRTLKSFFEVRPIFHWTKKRIEGHILMNFMLLVMENYLLQTLKKNLDISHTKLRNFIDDLEMSVLKIDNCDFASYAPINLDQIHILKAMNIPVPKNHKI